MNFKLKFTVDNITVCKENWGKLTDWEKGFITDMDVLCEEQELSNKQFEILGNIAHKIKKGEV